MTLWIVLTVMIAVAAAVLAAAVVRRQEARGDRRGEAAALRADLADLDAQAAAGVLPGTVAESLKAETLRRFLGNEAAKPAAAKPALGRGARMAVAVVLAAGLALGATLIYAKIGRPAPPAASGADAASDPTQVADLLPQLEAKVRANPDDATGLRLLGGAYMAVGRYGEAASAFNRLAKVAPGDADALASQGEALTRASSGVVTPSAAAAFRGALARAPADPRARYFLALAKDQGGDHAGAMDDWLALLKSAPPGAPWAAQVRAFVEQTAAERHEDISSRLPPQTPGPADAGAGQQAMIKGMVERLDARLKADPADVDGWVMLMRARLVLGQADEAKRAYERSQAAMAGDTAKQAKLTAAARTLGVPGV